MKIPNSLGIIGGQTNSALYFFGETANKLIYLDPHINQITTLDYETYRPKYFYKLDVLEMSPAFTAGFIFRNCKEYKNLIEHMDIHSLFKNPVFKLSGVVDKKKIIEEYEDDFCIINYSLHFFLQY